LDLSCRTVTLKKERYRDECQESMHRAALLRWRRLKPTLLKGEMNDA
jgi:hypothetical protein